MAEVCYPGFHLCSVTGGRCAEQALRYSPHVSKRQGVTPTGAIPGFQRDFLETQCITLIPLWFWKLLKGSGPKVQSHQWLLSIF